MSVTYHYYRYKVPYTEEIQTLEKAIERAKSDVDFEQAYPEKIVFADGALLDNEEIMRQVALLRKEEE
jgi:hypothetical protein